LRSRYSRSDIGELARVLIEQHGDDAALVAAQKADEFIRSDDREQVWLWLRLFEAINKLREANDD
jgi:hypothetical protein